MATAPPTAVSWNPERFERNLSALARRQPRLAERLRELPVPKSVQPALGRDGTPTFRLCDADDRPYWLGRTSMPSISAPAAIEHFDPGAGNALIPQIGTGAEAELLCARMPAHAAVFAYDADPLHTKLALHATDLAAHLESGRLVLLADTSLEDSLLAFLAEHPGYEFPYRLLLHPAVPKAEFERLRAGSEQTATVSAARQLETARAVATELADRPAPRIGDQPRVVLICGDPRPAALTAAAQLGAALAELGWPTASQTPSAPDRCTHVSRLLLIRDHRPDLVLLLNTASGRLKELLPATLPIAAWFWPGSAIGPAGAEVCGPRHQFFAATPELVTQLQAAGWSAERVHLLEIGVEPSMFGPAAPEAADRAACDVAVLSDAVDASAAAAGIRHHSHTALWERVGELLVRRGGRVTAGVAADRLSEAEKQTGLRIETEELRARFLELIRARLVDTAVAHADILELVRAGHRLRVWGCGWDGVKDVCSLVAGPVPDPTERNLVYQSARVVLFPVFNAAAAQMALEVIAAGGVPVMRTPESALTVEHPQTGDVFGLIPQYRDAHGLRRGVGGVLADTAGAVGGLAKVRERVLADHTLARRLQTIRDIFR
jgi:hypothetical protein